MPRKPKSEAQLGYVHAAAKRGEKWAQNTVKEWHGKKFGNLPKRKGSTKK